MAASFMVAASATAQTVRARTTTLGKGMQFRKADLSVEAQRRVLQGVNVWAWDAAPALPGTVDVHVAAYYLNDFGIREEDRGNPWIESERSRFVVERAQVRFEPVDPVRVTLGRQWVGSPLGFRDVDGARLRIDPQLQRGVILHADGFVGRDVQSGFDTFNSDAWDVQGLPIETDGGAPGGTRMGATVGIGWSDAALDVAWERGQRVVDAESVTGDERLGAALRGNVTRRVVLSSQASYHLLLNDVDRANLDLAWRAPWAQAVLSGGVEHRQPWFDASSIFNVFGARPFQGARLVYQHPVPGLNSSIEVRTWARAYDGNLDLGDFGDGADDARAVGVGAGHSTTFVGFGLPFEWKSFASYQSSPDGAQGGTQWLGDTRFRFPAVRRHLFLTGRFLGLYAQPGVTATQGEGTAWTTVVTAEVPLEFGTFLVSVDGTRSTWFDPNLNAWASFATELWF